LYYSNLFTSKIFAKYVHTCTYVAQQRHAYYTEIKDLTILDYLYISCFEFVWVLCNTQYVLYI